MEARISERWCCIVSDILAIFSGEFKRRAREAAICFGEGSGAKMKLPLGTTSCMSGSQMKTGVL